MKRHVVTKKSQRYSIVTSYKRLFFREQLALPSVPIIRECTIPYHTALAWASFVHNTCRPLLAREELKYRKPCCAIHMYNTVLYCTVLLPYPAKPGNLLPTWAPNPCRTSTSTRTSRKVGVVSSLPLSIRHEPQRTTLHNVDEFPHMHSSYYQAASLAVGAQQPGECLITPRECLI